MLDVCLLGTSGMMPLPGRWLTALMTRYNGSSLLIDCGEGTQIAIKEKGWSVHDIDIICITHFHGDHISGLPGLLLSMGNSERTKPVYMIGPKGLKRVVDSLRVIAPELPFELKFIELNEAEKEIELAGYIIRGFHVRHNIPCYGYSLLIKWEADLWLKRWKKPGAPKILESFTKGETIEEDGKYTPGYGTGPERKGIKLTYCTDTRPVAIVEMPRVRFIYM